MFQSRLKTQDWAKFCCIDRKNRRRKAESLEKNSFAPSTRKLSGLIRDSIKEDAWNGQAQQKGFDKFADLYLIPYIRTLEWRNYELLVVVFFQLALA
jgi:hypothetical protein